MAESIRQYVVDASFVLSYLLPDEESKLVDQYFADYAAGKIHLISTTLLPFEVANGILAAVQKKCIDSKTAQMLLSEFEKLHFDLTVPDASQTLTLALEHELTVYDAGYLWLSRVGQDVLLSLDTQLVIVAETPW